MSWDGCAVTTGKPGGAVELAQGQMDFLLEVVMHWKRGTGRVCALLNGHGHWAMWLRQAYILKNCCHYHLNVPFQDISQVLCCFVSSSWWDTECCMSVVETDSRKGKAETRRWVACGNHRIKALLHSTPAVQFISWRSKCYSVCPQDW